MRRFSRAILNCGGGAAAAAADGGAFPNPNRRTPDHPPYSEVTYLSLSFPFIVCSISFFFLLIRAQCRTANQSDGERRAASS